MKNMNLLFIVLILFGCSKVTNPTKVDKEYLIIFEELSSKKYFNDYKIVIIDKKEYLNFIKYYIPILNIDFINYTFVITKNEDENENIMITTAVTKNNNQKSLNDTYESDKKNHNSNYFKKINIADFNCLDGFYMDSPFQKTICLKRKDFIYSFTILGININKEIDLIEYKNLLVNKLDNFEKIYK
jgi:hypothetical protein